MKHQHDSANISGVESTFSTFQAWRQDIRYLVFEGISYYQALQTLTFVYHNMDTEINSSKYDLPLAANAKLRYVKRLLINEFCNTGVNKAFTRNTL